MINKNNKLPFKVPENYFEDLPLRIQDRLESTAERKSTSFYPAFRSRMAIAAMFIGLLAVGYGGFRILSGSGADLFLSADEKIEAIEYFGYDLDDELLIAAILDSDIEFTQTTEPSESDELIQYLSEEEIDFSKLLNDF